MRIAQWLSVLVLGALGFLGGCLVLARSGFTSSNKRAGWQVFVPAPQAYVMAAILFALAALALLWLIRQAGLRAWAGAVVAAACVGLAVFTIDMLRQALP